MNNIKYYLVVGALIVVVAFLCGAGLTYRLMPQKLVTQEKEVVKTQVVRQTHTIVRQDGSKEIITSTTKNVTDKKDKRQEVMAPVIRPDWQISVGYDTKHAYDAAIARRVLGPGFVGIGYNSGTNALRAFVTIEF